MIDPHDAVVFFAGTILATSFLIVIHAIEDSIKGKRKK
jgi:hypothetical protein